MDTKSESEVFEAGQLAQTRAFASDEEVQDTGVPPARLGRYVVLEEVGRGGMGVVWTAYDPKLDRKVAIKLLKASARTSTRQARFIREAQALAKLNHPNIVTVHDVDTHESRLYMAMEYIDGQTLEQWLRAGPGHREILEVFQQAGQGLAAAHAADITHRDFKPSNVLIAADGRVKVVDFGLAKHMGRAGEDDERGDDSTAQADDSAGKGAGDGGAPNIMAMIESSVHGKLTKVGRIVGTPAYMAPEQYVPVGKRGVGAWTDQFSFAVALYEALYGQLPFEGEDLNETCASVLAGNMRPPPRDSPVPGWVGRAVARALEFKPDQRYASMAEMLAALRADPALRRRRQLAYAGGLMLAGLAVLGVLRAAKPDAPPPVPQPCRGAGEHLEGIWDDDARSSVREGLMATRRPFAADTAERVTAGLDDYAHAWVAQHTAVCEATRIHGEQSEALLDVRMTCLDRRRSELHALVEVLATPREDTVAAAVNAVTALRPPGPCASAQPGIESELPAQPEQRAKLLELQASIDHASALLAAGRNGDARDQAAAAAKDAEAAGSRRLLAAAYVIEGGALRQLRETDEAQLRLRDAISVASEVGDVRTELGGWLDLLYIAGVTLDDAQQAADWQFSAENALRRAGSPKELEFKLALTVSAVLVKQNHLQAATRAGEQAWRIALEMTGAGSVQHAQALNNLGVVAAKSGQWQLAEQRLRESYELKKGIFGPNHPEVASNGMNLANALVQHAKQGDDTLAATNAYDEAERLYRQAVAFREQNELPNGVDVARALTMLGRLQLHRGSATRARETYQRALELLQAAPEATTEDVASLLTNLANVERLEHRYEQAEAYYREALGLQTGQHGESHAAVGTTRLQLCRLLADANHHREAISECTQALAILEATAEGRATPSLVSAHALLEQSSNALGRPQDASVHRARAAELERRIATSEQP